ncbi:hypothetical protein [Paraburkholderia fungorum]|uniref:hypothetical protein n=1 Tax=Paraburkholderia fungorum TaxID=134537 RepID=UPI0038BD1044
MRELIPDHRRTDALRMSYLVSQGSARHVRRISRVTVMSTGSAASAAALSALHFLLHFLAPKPRSMRCASTSRA